MDKDLAFLSSTFDGEFSGEFTSAVQNYEQEWIEGPQRATWDFREGEGGVDEGSLRAWFDNKMMSQVDVRKQGITVWNGFIWEMELSLGNVVLTKTMTDLANTVAITYVELDEDWNETGDEPYVEWDDSGTIWLIHSESVRHYGWHEELMESSGGIAEASERARTKLQRKADPFNTSAIFRKLEPGKGTLSITAVGRMVAAAKVNMFTDRLRYHPDYTQYAHGMGAGFIKGTDTRWTWTVADEIERIASILQTNGNWLYPEHIAANDTATRIGSDVQMSAVERLRELAVLRNSAGESYWLSVTIDGGVVYQKIDETPDYFLRPAPGGVEYPDGTVPTWEAKPGIIRDLDMGVGPALPNTWLSDRSLFFGERVSMRDGDEFASFHTRVDDLGDYYRILDANLDWLET